MKFKSVLIYSFFTLFMFASVSAIDYNDAVLYMSNTEISEYDVYGGVTGTNGKIGGAYDFDGIDDYLITDYSVPNTNMPYSISLWVYRDSNTDTDVVIGQTEITSAEPLGLIYGVSGNTNIYFRHAGLTNNVGTGFSTGQWHHIVMTYDGAGNVEGYLNNNNIVSNTGIQTTTASTNFNIGRYGSYDFHYLNGTIDDAVIYDRVITLTEISDIYNTGSGAKADTIASDYIFYATLDSLDDLSNNLNYCSAYNGITSINEYWDFDGTDDYIARDGFDLSDSTINLWAYADNDYGTRQENPFSFYIDGTHRMQLQFYASDQVVVYQNCGGVTWSDSSSGTVDDYWVNDDWNMITITSNSVSDTTKLYINKNEITDLNLDSSLCDYSLGSLNLGVANTGTLGAYWDGKIDQVSVWDSELSSVEISELYGLHIEIVSPVNDYNFTFDVENTTLEINTDLVSNCEYEYLGANYSMTTTDNLSHAEFFDMGVAVNSSKQFDITYHCTSPGVDTVSESITFYQQQVPLNFEIYVPQDQQHFDYDTNLITFHVETNYMSDCDYLVYNMSTYTPFTSTGAIVHKTNYTLFYPDVNVYPVSFKCSGNIVNETVILNVTFIIDPDTAWGLPQVTGQLPQVGQDIGGFFSNIGSGTITFIFSLAIVGSIVGLLLAIVAGIRNIAGRF